MKTNPLYVYVLFVAFLSLPAFAVPGLTTYQARIIKPDNIPLEASGVNFRFTILNPAADCALYVEDYSAINMSNSAGLVSFSLGTGTKIYPVSATTFTDVFNNSTPAMLCQGGGGTSFTATVDSIRKIVMQFNDGNGWQTLPAMNINAVPYAMYATKADNAVLFNNKMDTAFVQYSSIPTCTASQALQYTGSGFVCIAAGGSGGASYTVTAGDVTSALGYTPVDPATLSSSYTPATSFSTVTATVSSLGSSVTAVTSAVNNLSTSFTNLAAAVSGITTGAKVARLATSANIVLSGLQTIDGSAVAAGERVLVKNQTLRRDNGLYVAAVGAWTRAPELDTWTEMLGAEVYVVEGLSNQGMAYMANTANINGTLNTTNIEWTVRGSNYWNTNIAFGLDALTKNASGYDNAAFGNYSQSVVTTGSENTGVGNYTLEDLTTGNKNTAVGTAAMTGVTSGSLNTALGYRALSSVGTGNGNIGIGANAGWLITTGSNNVVIGSNTGASIATSSNNILLADGQGNERLRITASGAVGIGTSTPSAALEVSGGVKLSGASATIDIPTTTADSGYMTMSGELLLHAYGSNSIYLGRSAGSITNGGAQNTGIGHHALKDVTFGSDNVAVGDFTLSKLTVGGENTALGSQALSASVSGLANVAVGIQALSQNTANENTIVGAYALNRAGNGAGNTGMGYASMNQLTTGSNNVATGWMSLRGVTTGSSNVGLGYQAGRDITTGSGNVIIGGNRGTSFATDSNNISINDGVGNERIRVLGSGKVGIGTATPITALDVSGGVRIGTESAACAPALAGTIRYNAGVVQYCDGATWSSFGVAGAGITSFNGSTSSTQNLGTSTSGNSPLFTTANGVHTLNIPLASATGSVTAGLISNADYVNFSNKVNATSAAVIAALGYTPANSATVSSLQSSVAASFAAIAASSGDFYKDGSVSMTGTLQLNRNISGGNTSNVIDTGTAAGNLFDIRTSDADLRLRTINNNNLIFTTNANERMRITPTGLIGIGTTLPVTKLDVSGAIRISMDATTCAASYAGAIRYNAGVVQYCDGTTWSSFGVAGSGITALNGSTSGTQSFAINNSGNSPLFATANGVHTLSIPLASATGSVTAGLISNADYVNFSNKVSATSASVIAALGYTPASSTALGNYLVKTNNLSDLTSSATARTNLGLGTFATASTIDLGTASATGTLAVARLPAFTGDATSTSGSAVLTLANSGVTSGTYTKVTVNAKGLVTSGSQITASDISTALGYAPVSAAASSQWITSGTTISYSVGNVGIGTATPTGILDVRGGSAAAGSHGTSVYINAQNAGTGGYNGGHINLVPGTGTGAGTAGSVRIASGTFYNAAQLEIGSGAPGIAINNTGNSQILLNHGGGGWGVIGNNSAGKWSLGYSNTSSTNLDNSILTWTNSDNVGIGTTTPVTKLDVSGAIRVSMDSAACTASYAGAIRYNAGSVQYCNGTTWGSFGGSVTSAAVISALGYTPVSAAASSQWATSGTTINYTTGNVGIGTANPGAKLEVSGGIRVADGSAANPSFSFGSEVGTGFYRAGTNWIGLAINGTNYWNFDSANGMLSPTIGGGFIRSANGTAAAPTFTFNGSSDSGMFRPVANQIGFSTNGVERLRIDNSGNMGIGTSSPVARLSVESGGATGIQMKKNGAAALDTINMINDMDATGYFWLAKGSVATAAPSNANRLIGVTNEGNVEIYGQKVNATDKSGVLSLKTQAAGDGGTKNEVSMEFYADRNNLNTSSGFVGFESGTTFDLSLINNKSGKLNFGTNGTTNMTLSSAGNLGIGTSSPGSQFTLVDPVSTTRSVWMNSVSEEMLNVRSDEVGFTGIAITNTHGSSRSWAMGALSNTGSWGTPKSFAIIDQNLGNTRFVIDPSGNVGIGGAIVPGYPLHVWVDQNAFKQTVIENANTGSSAVAAFTGLTNAGGVNVGMTSTNGGGFGYLSAGGTGGLQIQAFHNSGDIIFKTTASFTERMRITSAGAVGIGTSAPRAALEVSGTVLMKPAVNNTASPINFLTGNLQYTGNNCGAFALHNMKDGGSYTFAVKGATSATCSFTAFTGAGTGALTVHMPTDHGATTASKHTLYTFLVMGSDVYVSWMPDM